MTEDIERVALRRPLPKISALVGSGPARTTGRIATAADLRFVDAAIALLQAADGARDESSGFVNVADPAAEVVISAVSYVMDVAEVTFKAVNSALIGEDLAAVGLAREIGLERDISLERLIEARNVLEQALEASGAAR